ncbi:MAG: lamin tail domain-containing protein, partial [Thermoguttaceae bacterium]
MDRRRCKRSATRRWISGQRRRPGGARFWQHRRLRIESLEERRLLSLSPIISEVDPGNASGIVDTLGNTADWLELYNPDPTAAANLSGWTLWYEKAGSNTPKTWTFPSNVILGPGESRVIFCDSADTNTTGENPLGELDTGYNLSKSGATLELLDSGGTLISSMPYPAMSSDTSYGPLETVNETDVVAAGATASYYCPTNGTLVDTGTSTATNWTLPGFTGAGNWATGATGLGFCGVSGFACTLYHANIGVGSITTAEQVISTPADQTSVYNETEPYIDFMDTGGGGHFTSSSLEKAFPGMSIGQGLDNYVLQATGSLTITSAQAGYYTFGVNSDDGFQLTITGANFGSPGGAYTTCSGTTLAYSGPRSPGDTLGTTYLAAGTYPINLVYYQDTGGASVEFYAAKEGSSSGVASFDSNSVLVGNGPSTNPPYGITASGGASGTTYALAVSSTPFTGAGSSGSFASAIATNVHAAVQSAISTAGATSLYVRIPFSVSNLSSLTSLMLRMKYVDGYVAWLNGVQIASENAPSSPAWNSTATTMQTSSVQANTYEDVDISSFLNSSTTGHLTATGNVLAIQVFMDSFTEDQMLAVPELAEITSVIGGDFIYSTPSPGTPNLLADVQASLAFSQPDGLYSSAFQLALTANVSGTSIYYTMNNAVPGVQQAISSITYSGTTATVTTSAAFDTTTTSDTGNEVVSGYATGDTVQIAGATPSVYDGPFPITVTGTNTFTYTLPSRPTSNASGSSMTATSGTLYTAAIPISTTTVVQAAMVVGGVAAPYQTQTYVFPLAVATQSAAPAGYPTAWDGTLDGVSVPADYAMSPVAGYTTAQIADALALLPTMSIVTTNTDMWGSLGIYSNSMNHNLEVPGSLEYFNPLTGTTSWSGLAGLSMYGGVGRDEIYNSGPDSKHAFQIAFDQPDGPGYMAENLFGSGYEPDGLVLRQGFNDGWSWGGANTAFIHDEWVRDTLTALGTPNTPGIWVQLYVNGLYWGVYNAVNHIDAAYAAYYFGGQKSDYDVYHYASDGFEVNYGTMEPWDAMFNIATYGNIAGTGTASPTALANPTAYALMSQYLNLPDFCDYIIVNYYAGNLDWDNHNYSALYRPGLGFVFQDWDGEMIFYSGWNGSPDVNVTGDDNTGDPTQLFVQLLANPDFRQLFADRVYNDLTTALSPTNAAARYENLANILGYSTVESDAANGTTTAVPVLAEAARWGNLGEMDGTWDELGTPQTWASHISSELSSFIATRTAEMFTQFANSASINFTPYGDSSGTVYNYTMYPSVAPPTMYINGTAENGGTFNPGSTLTMTAPSGATIYYTTDGSDPRTSTTGFTVASITLSGTTATVTLDDTDTGLSNGETVSISGAAQSAYDSSFVIGNVTVSSTAGTTTFTCTVTGSPASPATTEYTYGTAPVLVQPIIAATPLGGAVSSTAQVYTSGIALTQGEEINARVYYNGVWSAVLQAEFVPNMSNLRVSEVMYDPLPATAAEINAGYVVSDTSEPNRDFQFIEIQNTGTTAVPLAGLAISGGVDFTFPSMSLAAGAYVVVCSDTAAFVIRYNAALTAEFGSNWQSQILAGQFSDHHLSLTSDEIELSSPNGGVIEDFTYQSSWLPQTAGGGFALVPMSATESTSLLDSSSGWEASGTPNGTPGYADPVTLPLPGAVVINEVSANPTGAPGDMIDLYNTTSQAISIGGWWLSDNSANLAMYQIPAGTTIAADGYYVLTQDNNFGFTLDPDGSTVYLSNNYNGQAGGYQVSQGVDAMPPGSAYGLYTTSDGNTNFELLQTPNYGTLSGTTYSGAANSTPYVSPLVVDQIMYNPTQPTAAEAADGYVDNDFQYLDLYNASGSPVALSDYYVGHAVGYTPGWLPDGTLANDFTLAGIASSGTVATATINNTATGLQNGDSVYVAGAAQSAYDGDFTIGSVTVNSSAGTTTFTYPVSGSPSSPATAAAGQTLTAGKNSEFEALTSGATATWSASNVPAGSYTLYAHLNLYDGDNNPLSLDESAQYTVTVDGVPTTMTIDQDQTPATLDLTSLTYNNTTGLVTAAANNAVVNNDSLVAGSIVHISGATPSQYNGTFVVQSANATSFTYSLAGGLNLAAATGTITAGLNDAWVSLGSYATSGSVSVTLTRTSAAKASEWTLAGTVELVGSQQTVVFGTPTFGNTNAIPTPPATLAPGQHAVIVSNYAAFEERYNPTGTSNILVLGVFSSHLNNSSDKVDVYQVGNPAAGDVAPLDGYVPFYKVDHIDYDNAAPWPTAPDGNGPALVRIHVAGYGSDPINWMASNVGGTPGAATVPLDPIPPTVPTNLAAHGTLNPSQINLTWPASTDTRSSVAYYDVYRDGTLLGTTTTNSYADTTAAPATQYSYTVSAVNRDGYTSAPSAAAVGDLPGIIATVWQSSTQLAIYFSEPLAPATAGTKANYSLNGGLTISSVALGRDNTKVTLTTSAATAGNSYTVTMSGLTTASGNQLPATLTDSSTYQPVVAANSYNIGGTDSLDSYSYSGGVWTVTGAGGDMWDGTEQSEFVYAAETGNFDVMAYVTITQPGDGSWTKCGIMATGISGTSPAAPYIFNAVTSGSGVAFQQSDQSWWVGGMGNNMSDWIRLTYNASTSLFTAYYSTQAASTAPASVTWNVVGTRTCALPSVYYLGLVVTSHVSQSVAATAQFTNFTLPNFGVGGYVDVNPPATPANLCATVTGSNNQIALSWSPVTDLTSGIDHYQIYRNGTAYATSTTTSYTDTSAISPQTVYTYQVAAVNYDGVIGAESAPLAIAPPGIASASSPNSTTVYVNFNEPVNATQNAGNYTINGVSGSVSRVVVQSNGYTVVLTTSAGSGSKNVTASNVATAAGTTLPTTSASFTYSSGGSVPTAWGTASVAAVVTDDPKTGLSGSVGSTTATVTARISGVYYATSNNNGAWTLPEGAIQPALTAGSYNVSLFAYNGSAMAFATSLSGVQYSGTAPTASVSALSPNPRNTPVSSVPITFSEPVNGFGQANLQLTLDGISLSLDGTTLTTSNNQTWTLGNLGGLTAAQGTYVLSVSPAGWGVADNYGNPLTASTATTWVMDTTPPTAIVTTAPPTINAAGAGSSSTTLTVTYADSGSGINPASLSA